MRLPFFACALFVLCPLAGCSVEEAPNPPATRDGTEKTGEETGASLPPPSSPGKKPPSSGGETPGDEETETPGTKPAATSGVDPEKTLGDLGTSEKKKLCDWEAALHGGYGKTTKCPEGTTVENAPSQADCVKEMPACAATVAEAEACFKVNAADVCSLPILTAPECAPLRECLSR